VEDSPGLHIATIEKIPYINKVKQAYKYINIT